MLTNVKAWFTDTRRKAIYAVAASLSTMLVSLGVVSESDSSQYLILTALVLQAVASGLQLINLNRSQLTSWFTATGRAAVYSGAVTLAAVGVALGWFTDGFASNALSILSSGLTVLGSVLAVVTIGNATTVETSEVAPE